MGRGSELTVFATWEGLRQGGNPSQLGGHLTSQPRSMVATGTGGALRPVYVGGILQGPGRLSLARKLAPSSVSRNSSRTPADSSNCLRRGQR